jgi:hypothetical protein
MLARGFPVRIFLLLSLAMVAVSSAQSQQAATPSAQTSPASAAKLQPVVIQVNDPTGAPVPGAQVRLAPMPDTRPESMQTDQKGQLTLQLKPGGYSMFVSMQGFSGYNAHLDVASSEAPQTVSVTLRIGTAYSPLVEPTPDPHVLTLTVAPFTDKFRITADDLKGLPRKSAVVHNPHSNADEKYEGVVLADLLAKYGAPLGKDLRGPALANYVVATGADGYRVVYSLAELDPAFHPGDVLIADTMDGKPLDAHNGPFRLVSTEDKRPARGVRNLIAIELKPAQ